MKKITALFIVMLMMFSSLTVASANNVNVKINGISISNAYISNGKTMIPATFPGADSIRRGYDAHSNSLTFVNSKAVVSMQLGSPRITVNGVSKNIDVAAALSSGNPFIPLRDVLEPLGATISWDAKTSSVSVSLPTSSSNPNKNIILATTTSTVDSGLLDSILPHFEKETGYTVKVISVGTGKAIQMGVDGEADVLLVHAKDSEIEFMKANNGVFRRDVMYNDFILVGAPSDPAGIAKNAPNNINEALKAINSSKAIFVSRGDDSGTDKLEKGLWKAIGITPNSSYYVSAGSGMGDVLKMADEKQGYTITDRATYLSMKDKLDLVVLCEGDTKLFNQYGIIPVNPSKSNLINVIGAIDFANWMLSNKGQELIGQFGIDKFGKALFVPNAK